MNELEKEIYIQLLELYVYDLEVEIIHEVLKNTPRVYRITEPWIIPYGPYYDPLNPYKVTCQQNTTDTQ
jgi:hypothetical protein